MFQGPLASLDRAVNLPGSLRSINQEQEAIMEQLDARFQESHRICGHSGLTECLPKTNSFALTTFTLPLLLSFLSDID